MPTLTSVAVLVWIVFLVDQCAYYLHWPPTSALEAGAWRKAVAERGQRSCLLSVRLQAKQRSTMAWSAHRAAGHHPAGSIGMGPYGSGAGM